MLVIPNNPLLTNLPSTDAMVPVYALISSEIRRDGSTSSSPALLRRLDSAQGRTVRELGT